MADRRGGAMSPAGKRGRFRLAGKGPARDDFEPPKYIQQLIASINDGAKSAQLGSLAFVAIGLFLLATSFSATDEDLLMGKSIAISQLGGVAVPVALSFGFMPAVFVAVHLYTLIRFEMLAANVRQLTRELDAQVKGKEDQARCRQLLANVEFVHALATPGATWVYRWTAWGMIAVFPIFVLLLVQLGSLRLQDHVVNVVHHGAIFADLVLLQWFTLRLRGARMPAGVDGWFMRRGLHRAIAMVPVLRRERLLWLPLAVLVADLCWCRVPSAAATTVGDGKTVFSVAAPRMSPRVDETWIGFMGSVIVDPWVHPVDQVLCPYVKIGCRYLSVTGRVLVVKVWDNGAFVELRAGGELTDKRRASFDQAQLRNRMLRFANLSNSLLFNADLFGAELQGASLDGAWLHGARLDEASLQGASLSGVSLQGASLRRASLQGAMLNGASLQGASLDQASLQGATLIGASLQDATLVGASLEGTILAGARAQGAMLQGSSARGAQLAGALLQGAILDRASLEGADLSSASLHGAHLVGVSLQLANLELAKLHGARLNHLALEGANLSGAVLRGANLRRANLWNVVVDEHTDLSLADLQEVTFVQISAAGHEPLLGMLSAPHRGRVLHAMTARPQATRLTGYKADREPFLVSSVTDDAWSALTASQKTADPNAISESLAKMLADEVAPISAMVAERFAVRWFTEVRDILDNGSTPDPLTTVLIIPLGCRLLDHVATKRVKLPDDAVQLIRTVTGTCPPPAPTTGAPLPLYPRRDTARPTPPFAPQ